MKPRIFIGSSVKNEDIAYALQENLQFDAMITVWTQGVFQASSNSLDDLIKTSDKVDFAVFVFSPEDKATINSEETLTVRDNVVFELGLFLGKLGKERTFFLRQSESKRDRVPTDLQGVTPLEFQTPDSPDDLLEALGPASNQIRKKVQKLGGLNDPKETLGRIIYDSSKGTAAYDIVGKGQSIYKGDVAVTPKAQGNLTVDDDGALVIERKNSEGRFELRLENDPVIRTRKLQVSFEAQVGGGEHTLNIVLKDEKTKKWSDNKEVQVTQQKWTPIKAMLKTPPIFLRIDDQNVSDPGSKLLLRKLVVRELD